MPGIEALFIYPITTLIEVVFVCMQKIFREAGLSVIVVSCVISALCLPMYAAAERVQRREREARQRMAAGIAKIKAAFSGDERFMLLSAYYRQNRYHPAYALRSSFGLLIQIPFFIAGYAYLSHLQALHGASFLFIRDLGAPDALLPLPFVVGGGGSINVLPVLMTLLNIASTIIYTKDFSFKDKLPLFGMAALFFALLYNASSGLVLYWTMNNLFSCAKNAYSRIAFSAKKPLLALLFSLLCIAPIPRIWYMLQSASAVCTVATALLIALAAFPFLVMLIKKTGLRLPALPYDKKKTFALAAFSFAGCWMVTGVLVPSLLIASSPEEFVNIGSHRNPLYFAANAALQCAGFFLVWPLALYLLFPRKIKKALAFGGFVLFAALLCDTFLFPGNYGLLSPDMTFNGNVRHSIPEILVNAGVVAALAAALFAVVVKGGLRAALPAALLPFFALSVLSAHTIGTVWTSFREAKKFIAAGAENPAELQPLFHLSKTGKNTVVIMLDRATSIFFPEILKEKPELTGVYEGFVYYPNTVSFNGYTRLGAPPLFGGYEYTPLRLNERPNISMREKHNEALLLLPRLFSEAGYEVTITDPPYPNYSYKDDLRIYNEYPGIKAYITDGVYSDVWLKAHNVHIPSRSDILTRDIFWYSVLKTAPLAFREAIYGQGLWLSPVHIARMITSINAYSVLDYLPRLSDFESGKENSFLFLVNNTTHENNFYQAPEYRPALSVTKYAPGRFKSIAEYYSNIAALMRLGDWFTWLKSEGVYDNTRVIIAADHGTQQNYVPVGKLPFSHNGLNPLLLVKDFNAQGALVSDNSFMTNADVPYLALRGQLDGACNPWTGTPITIEDKDKPVYIARSAGVHRGDPRAGVLLFNREKDYYVHGNIFDEKNWTRASD